MVLLAVQDEDDEEASHECEGRIGRKNRRVRVKVAFVGGGIIIVIRQTAKGLENWLMTIDQGFFATLLLAFRNA